MHPGLQLNRKGDCERQKSQGKESKVQKDDY